MGVRIGRKSARRDVGRARSWARQSTTPRPSGLMSSGARGCARGCARCLENNPARVQVCTLDERSFRGVRGVLTQCLHARDKYSLHAGQGKEPCKPREPRAIALTLDIRDEKGAGLCAGLSRGSHSGPNQRCRRSRTSRARGPASAEPSHPRRTIALTPTSVCLRLTPFAAIEENEKHGRSPRAPTSSVSTGAGAHSHAE
jgi:hypothetical protein